MDLGNLTINKFDLGEIDIQTHVDITNFDFVRVDTFISKNKVHSDVINFFPSDDIQVQYQIVV